MRVSFNLWLTVGVLLGGLGCGRHACQSVCHGGNGHENLAGLPAASRTNLEPDPQKLPGMGSLKGPEFAGSYRALSEMECQCMAVHASSMGNLLDQEGSLADGKADLQQAMQATAAKVARNKDAGTALELYFNLAEAEAKWDIVEASLKEVKGAIKKGEELKKQGLRVPPEFEEFQKKEIQLWSDQVRLAGGIKQLNRQLGKMLDLPGIPEQEQLWPTVDLTVAAEPVDIAAAISVGLATRPELALLRQAQEDNSRSGQAAVRKLLSSVSPLLGMSGGCLVRLKLLLAGKEKGVRQEQLQEYHDQQQREISAEIRQAAEDMGTQVQVLALARERARNALARFEEQKEKYAKGSTSSVEVTSTRLTWLKTRADLIHEAAAWHIFRIKLKQAQGLLVMECGHDGHDFHEVEIHGAEGFISPVEQVNGNNAASEIVVEVPPEISPTNPLAPRSVGLTEVRYSPMPKRNSFLGIPWPTSFGKAPAAEVLVEVQPTIPARQAPPKNMGAADIRYFPVSNPPAPALIPAKPIESKPPLADGPNLTPEGK